MPDSGGRPAASPPASPPTPPPTSPPRTAAGAGPAGDSGGQTGIKTLSGDITGGGIGVNFGHIQQYLVSPKATPAERVRAARDCLRAGLREQAEKLLTEAFGQQYRSIDIYHYRLLALLSHRSLEELSNEHWHQLRQLLAAIRPGGPLPDTDPGGYYAATRAIGVLLHNAVEPRGAASDGAAAGAGPGGADAAGGGDGRAGRVHPLLAALPAERREEIDAHLGQLIEQVDQDRRDDAEAAQAAARRLAGDRVRRVPYFFTADPLPPRASARTDAGPVGTLMAGALLAGGALVWLLVLAASPGASTASAEPFAPGEQSADPGALTVWLVLLQLAAAGTLLFVAVSNAQVDALLRRMGSWPAAARVLASGGSGHRGRLAFLAALAAESAESLASSGTASDPEIRRRNRFRGSVATLVNRRFDAMRPDPPRAGADWLVDSRIWRLQLIADLTDDHWRSGSPAGLDWMIQRRAAELARSWSSGELRVPRPRPLRLPLVLVAVHAILLATTVAAASSGDFAGAAVVVALWPAVLGGGWLAARGFAEQELVRARARRHAADLAAHGPLLAEVRARRPSDLEMAEWLELDQRHLKAEMRGEHRMEGRDILFSFFVVEAAEGCVRARVGGGPARYSTYLAKLFVLTSRGVWMSSWQVDAATGVHTGRNDVVFRYDAINSAMLDTVGRGPAGTADDIGGALRYTPGADDGPPREALRLVLANRQYLDVFLENYALLETGEDTGALRELARDSSGAADGFRTLAALATEGKQWIDQRREYARAALLGPAGPAGAVPAWPRGNGSGPPS